MLRFVVRRLLWAIPTLFGISLVVFFLTTLIPDPAASAPPGTAIIAGQPVGDELEEARRARFLDLPRFFNANPPDVRTRAESCVERIADDGLDRAAAAKKLAQLGGAALPYVIPKLDELPALARAKVALALEPIAARMGLGEHAELATGDGALTFWTRLWEERSPEFTGPSVHRAVTRIVEHADDPRTEIREKDLVAVDTFALPEIMLALKTTESRPALARLTEVAAHVTGRGPVMGEQADAAETRVVRAAWLEWWYVHESDYVTFEGSARVLAALGQTRYGKWLLRTATGHLGLSVIDGEPIADKIAARAPVTLFITVSAMFLSYALAIPIGVFTAWRRGRPADVLMAGALFLAYSLPAFFTAEVLRRAFGEGAPASPGRLVLPILTLTLTSLATLSRYQRAAMIDVLSQDYVRTARAKGVGRARLLIVHALRNALLPTVTLAGLQLPALFGATFIVEEVFHIPGLGYETLRAVEAHDAFWLIAVIVVAAVLTVLGLLASDVAYGYLDPRVRETIAQRARAEAA